MPWAPLESAEEVEVYELDHVVLADGLIPLTKEVVVYGIYDLVLLNRAVAVGVVPGNQGVPGGNRYREGRRPPERPRGRSSSERRRKNTSQPRRVR